MTKFVILKTAFDIDWTDVRQSDLSLLYNWIHLLSENRENITLPMIRDPCSVLDNTA